MKLGVKDFAKLTGVSVRTLHYYDEIGLLKPDYVDDQNGYRFYEEEAFSRMQEILFYRELDFSLKTIKDIISSLQYDKHQALAGQKALLTLKKERLERIIQAIDRMEKGEKIMNNGIFDEKEYINARDAYKEEVIKRWGDTEAYKESEEKTSDYSEDQWNELGRGMNDIISEFARARSEGAYSCSDTAYNIVQRLKDFITENQYTCTNEILSCLGMMYVQDERFKANIDKHGKGTAEFMSKAIEAYCSK